MEMEGKVTEAAALKAVAKMKKKKATGQDGIPTELLQAVAAHRPKLLADLANAVLERGIFPKAHKVARLVLLRNPDKLSNEPSSFRPLCMINSTDKMLETIIASRLSQFIEEKGLLSSSQHGFRLKHSTIDANGEVVSIAKAEMQKTLKARKLCILITVDVQNAFNTVRWDAIMQALEGMKVPPYLLKVIASYLSERRLLGDGRIAEVTGGCRRGRYWARCYGTSSTTCY